MCVCVYERGRERKEAGKRGRGGREKYTSVFGMSGMGRSGGGGNLKERRRSLFGIKKARERGKAVGSSRPVRCGCIQCYPPPLPLWQKDLKPQELSSGRS